MGKRKLSGTKVFVENSDQNELLKEIAAEQGYKGIILSHKYHHFYEDGRVESHFNDEKFDKCTNKKTSILEL